MYTVEVHGFKKKDAKQHAGSPQERKPEEFFSKQTKHGSAGPASLRSSVVYKQAAETEGRLRAACVCGQPALPACYCTSLFKSEQSDDEGS